ncbi:MAG: hypothetical protein QNJ53_05565 [Pleurocapsa sp. MO_192.B19]|nr:hypothetical protein [Pleurocapsa sp. MO_192.B19]
MLKESKFLAVCFFNNQDQAQNKSITMLTELGCDLTDDTAKGFLPELRKTALAPEAIGFASARSAIARAVLYAVSQSDDVDVNEVIVRSTASAF